MFKKLFLVIPVTLLFLAGSAGAQEEILPNAGITPDSPFYFLDRFGESLQRLFTFGEEGEARLRIRFAEERVSEIRLMVQNKGVDARGLEIAETRLKQHLEDANNILENSNSEIDDEDEIRNSAKRALDKLEDLFDEREDELEDVEDELERLLNEALDAGDDARADEIRGELSDVQFQLELLDSEEDIAEKVEDDDLGDIDDVLEEIFDAEKEIVKAEERIARETSEGSDVSEAIRLLNSSREFLSRAYEAYELGDYALAEELAESSKDFANESREGEYFDDMDDEENELDDEDDTNSDDDIDEDDEDDSDDIDDEEEDDDISMNFRNSIGLLATPLSPFLMLFR